MTTAGRSQKIQSESTLTTNQTDWVNIIKQWKASGMSQSAYCEANNINYNQFVYQSAKLSARTQSNSKLLPVKVTQPDHVAPVQNNFILHYPSGLKLQIPINAHPDAIKALLNCIEV
jgi:hypothetical protein